MNEEINIMLNYIISTLYKKVGKKKKKGHSRIYRKWVTIYKKVDGK